MEARKERKRRPGDEGSQSRATLFVRNLPFSATNKQLEELFSQVLVVRIGGPLFPALICVRCLSVCSIHVKSAFDACWFAQYMSKSPRSPFVCLGTGGAGEVRVRRHGAWLDKVSRLRVSPVHHCQPEQLHWCESQSKPPYAMVWGKRIRHF